MEKKINQPKKLIHVTVVVSSNDSFFAVLCQEKRGISMLAYNSILDVIDDFPMRDYSLVISTVRTIDDINQIVSLW